MQVVDCYNKKNMSFKQENTFETIINSVLFTKENYMVLIMM